MTATGMRGKTAETLALKYLRKQGLKLITKNYHCRFGEIDIIMRDNEYMVFVEVRYRKNSLYGGALASIDWRKQEKLKRTAAHYLQVNNISDTSCRFDILCLTGEISLPNYQWLSNAFE